MTCTSSLAVSAVSLAVSLSTYTPFVEKLALVFAVAAFVNVTVPGPLTFVHDAVSLFDGSPSSVTVPASVADAGDVIVWSGPALAVGAWFAGAYWIVSLAAADSPYAFRTLK